MNKYLILLSLLSFCLIGCRDIPETSDQKQAAQNERILQEGSNQVGMPAIKNFRERKLLKQILELRDQADFITYTYLENLAPTVVKGHTALGGKLTYLGISVGYGIPYSTQFTSPSKVVMTPYSTTYSIDVLPQADPNGLFSPSSADGTWLMMKDPDGNVKPQYIEPKIVTFSYKLPFD